MDRTVLEHFIEGVDVKVDNDEYSKWFRRLRQTEKRARARNLIGRISNLRTWNLNLDPSIVQFIAVEHRITRLREFVSKAPTSAIRLYVFGMHLQLVAIGASALFQIRRCSSITFLASSVLPCSSKARLRP